MESNQIDMFIITKGKYFRSEHLMEIRNRLQSLDDSKKILLQTLQFHDPTIILVVSLLVGALGIDRFMIGDIGLGVLKLITCGGLGIWAIVDWFLIMGLTKDKNMEKLQPFLY
jgi:TM2 domain-containing membrane protein YozV